MYRWLAVLAWLSACSFDPTGSFGSGSSDADADVVAPIADAAPAPQEDAAREPSVDAAVPAGDAAPALRIAYNIEGAEVTGIDFPGTWQAGPAVCNGAAWSVFGDIAGTVDDALFRDYGYSNGTPIQCALGEALPAGEYEVTLIFAEVWYGAGCDGGGGVGVRVFDIALEGEVRETDIDTAIEGGCCAPEADVPGAPFVRSFLVNITDGVLDVELTPSSEDTAAMVSAIELRSVAAQ